MNPAQPHAVPPWFPLFLVPLWFAVVLTMSFVLSRLSGWSLLARRFRACEPFSGETWNWQSARFRGWCNYNNCLKIGANEQALYLAVAPLARLFFPFPPPLLIPWNEIQVETGTTFFGWYPTARLRIGNDEQISVRTYGKLVDRLRQAAGPGWPLYAQEQSDAWAKP